MMSVLFYYITLDGVLIKYFTLGLNAAKNTHYIKKASNKSYSELNFVQKSRWVHVSTSTSSGARYEI